MEQAFSFRDTFKHRIAAVLATPDRPTDCAVLLCHGFLSNKNSTTNKTLTRLLLDRGIATCRFDFFGQGESEGPFEHITLTTALDQAQSALAHVRAQGFCRLGLMGSSFGGLVAVLLAAQQSDLRALALKCPVMDFPETLRLEFGDERMAHWKQHNEIPNVLGGPRSVALQYRLYEDCLAFDAYKAAASIQAPTLIVQGGCDELVPSHQSQTLYDLLTGIKRLDILQGADHGFTKGEDFRTMTHSIAGWFTSHLADA